MMVKSREKVNFLVRWAGWRTERRRPGAMWLLGAAAMLMLSGCGSQSPEELLAEGEMLMNTKQVFEAELKFQDFLEKYSDHADAPKAHFGLALCAWQDQDYERMREQLDRTVEGVGGLADSLGFQAAALKLVSFKEQKAYQQALDEALATSATLAALPPEPRYTYNLMTAELYTMTGDDANAIELCTRLLDIEDASPAIMSGALQRLVQIYTRMDDINGAIQICEDFLGKHPDSPLSLTILTNIGFLYLRDENQEMADQKLDEAEKMIQTNIDKALAEDEKAFWLIQLARLQRDRGKMDAVAQSLDTIISEYPLSSHRPQAMIMRAEVATSRQQFDESIAILENVARDYANERPAAQAVQMIDQVRVLKQRAVAAPLDEDARPTTGTATTTDTATTDGVSTQTAPVVGDEPTTGPAAGQDEVQ